MSGDNENSISVINLPTSTVLFNIFSLCSLKDLYNLRCVSRDFRFQIDFYLRKIKRVRLESSFVKNRQAFNVLAANCCCINYLNISRCGYLHSQEILLAKLLKNNFKHLTEINLSYSNNITVKSIQDIIVYCKELKILKLTNCDWFTTAALDSLTFHQSKLQFADFTKCTNLSETSILKFISKFTDLRFLSLAFVHSVTEKVLYAVIQYSPKLECLIIYGLHISTDAFRDFKNMRPDVNFCVTL